MSDWDSSNCPQLLDSSLLAQGSPVGFESSPLQVRGTPSSTPALSGQGKESCSLTTQGVANGEAFVASKDQRGWG